MTDDDFDEDDEEAVAARIARHANNTPADDRMLAMRVLREVVDNPSVKATDRAAAANQLLKAVNEMSGQADEAAIQAYDLTDEQLLDVIRVAQLQRAQAAEPNVPRGTSAPDPVPTIIHPIPSVGLLEALAAVPDIDPLCL
jgi:hypothetical protein